MKIRKALESQIKGNDFTLQREEQKIPTPLPMAVANSLRGLKTNYYAYR
jgi:hypothetical protein